MTALRTTGRKNRYCSSSLRGKDVCGLEGARAALDVWLRLITSTLDPLEDGSDSSWIPATGKRHLISRGLNRVVNPQVGHKDFPASKPAALGYLFLVNGECAGKLYVFKGSHHYVSTR